MKFRKDKTNTAVYTALQKYTGSGEVRTRLDSLRIWPRRSYSNGFATTYWDQEFLASEYFRSVILECFQEEWLNRYGDKAAMHGNKLAKSLFCRGVTLKKKNLHQCHHPLCPLCFSRKQYRLIRHLKPYLVKGNKLTLFRCNELVENKEQIGLILSALEGKAKTMTASMTKSVHQWIRQPHLSLHKESGHYMASYLVLAVCEESKEDQMKEEALEKAHGLNGCVENLPCSMDSMSDLLTNYFYHDSTMARRLGVEGLADFNRILLQGRYRAKHGG